MCTLNWGLAHSECNQLFTAPHHLASAKMVSFTAKYQHHLHHIKDTEASSKLGVKPAKNESKDFKRNAAKFQFVFMLVNCAWEQRGRGKPNNLFAASNRKLEN